MMKKRLLTILLSAIFLGGCTYNVDYTPKHGGTYDYSKDAEDEGEEQEEVLYATYNFYFSYSNSTYFDSATQKNVKCPIYSVVVPMMEPMGSCPSELDADPGLTGETARANRQSKIEALAAAEAAKHEGLSFEVDPTFPKFIGFSATGVAAFESNLWDFSKDYIQSAVVNLYGVWVSEVEAA